MRRPKASILLFSLFILVGSLTFSMTAQPVHLVYAQTVNSNNASASVPSTVWREYPYIPSHLVENTTHYVYVTDWGNYTFSKTLPYVCLYTYRNGKTMVSFSTFWFNTSNIAFPLPLDSVTVVSDTSFEVNVTAYDKLQILGGKAIANLVQIWNFNRTDKPKVSVLLNNLTNLNFNIYWVVAGYQYAKQNETSTINCSQTMSYWKKDVKVEMGNTFNVTDWREWLIVDWGDEGVADVWLGQFSIFGFSLAVVKVDFTVNDGQVDPSVVGTSTIDYATAFPFQRKSFYANGRFWVFYSDGANMVYSTSTDGSTWTSAATVRAAAYAYMFSVWFDGAYMHYAYAYNSSIYYRRGTPNSDGSITWSASEQTVSTTYNSAFLPMISVDSSGYVWIGYRETDGTYYYPYIIRSGNNNGVWGATPSGFPYKLSTQSEDWMVSPIPLTGGKVLAVYAESSVPVKAKSWNGSAWGTEVSTTSGVQTSDQFSAVAQGDDVHLAFQGAGAYNIVYVKYSYSSNSFGTETILQANATGTSAPVISINTVTNDLYVFWAGCPASNHIYYRKYTASAGTWETAVDWIAETSYYLTGNDRLTCFYQAYGTKTGLVYMAGITSPFNVKFAYLALNVAPNAPALNSPAAGCRFNPSANVTFTWLFSDNDTGDGQSAFQLQIGDSGFTAIYLDTGKVSSTSQNTTQTLPSNMTVGVYYWRVTTWDTYGEVQGSWSSGRAIIVDGLKVSQYILDLVGEAVCVQAVYAYDGLPITNANVSYAGLYASTNSSGWAEFNVSGLASVDWSSESYGVSEPTYGLTYSALNQTVALHKLQVQPFTVRANNFIGSPAWDDVNRKLSFTTSGTCIVKVGDMGMPLRVEVDGAVYTGWTYDSASQEVAVNNLHSNVTLVWQSSPSGGGGGGGGGEAGGGGGGGTSGAPVAPPVFVPPHEAAPLVNVGLVVIVVVVAGAYAYSQTARPKKVSEKWRQRQKQAKNVEWKKKDRFEE